MRAISFPFSLDTSGKISSTTDPTKIYKDRVLTLLSTVVYQRPMRAAYGVDIARSLYETMDDMYASIGDSIVRAITTFLPYITIQDILVDLNYPVETGTRVTVAISLPNGSVDDVSINSSTFFPSGQEYGRSL